MTGNYAYTPQIWPPVATVLLLIVLAVHAWRRRSLPGALPFMFACLFAAVWMAGSAMEYLAQESSEKFFWVRFQVSFQLPYKTAVTFFFLEYTWPKRWLTRRNLALLSIPLLIVVGIIFTNDIHHWIWRDFLFEGERQPVFGGVTWYLIAYGYGLALVNVIASAWLLIHSPQHRIPVVFMLIGLFAGHVTYLLQRLLIIQPNLLLDVLSISFAYLMYAIALFGFRIFDPISLAHKTAIEQLQAGILVLDPQGRVVSLNTAAERIFEAPADQARGRLIQELLPASDGQLIADASGTEVEIDLKSGQELRHFTLTASLLNDWRGCEVGRLLLVQDVTDQKQAQAQIFAQQRALATLEERERLARELHDSIGQVLGYTGFQLEAVYNHIQDGQAAIAGYQAAAVDRLKPEPVDDRLGAANCQLMEASDQLTQMSSIIEAAHADIREYILNLRLAPSDRQPFFAALQHYLDGFSQNYAIQTRLSVGPGVDEGLFGPEVQMQLFRIIQEAHSNARKHGQASCVQVSFEKQASQVRIQIQDNGRGFNAGPATGAGERRSGPAHFGLRFMRERAEQVGGRLQVRSRPGEGTTVTVDVPVNGNSWEAAG